MEKEVKNKLINLAYKIINDERLDKPKKISIYSPLGGTRVRRGVCRKINQNQNQTDYEIKINSTKTVFYPDENGKYISLKLKCKVSKATIGKERDTKDIIETIAHEIAHLKYFDHSPEHKSYTKYLFNNMIKIYNRGCC